MQKYILLFFIFPLCLSAQKTDSIASEIEKKYDTISITWQNIAKGIDFCETDAPFKSIINDSKITFLKLSPSHFDFKLMMASELKIKSLSADVWADSFDLDIVINAGMYDLAKKMHSKGLLKSTTHSNNDALLPNYKSIIAFNPKDTTSSKCTVFDLECKPWESIKNKYSCYAQGLRMLDCKGEPIGWNKRKQSCSMLITAVDSDEMLYFIFCRSPYTHNEMISFMRLLPFKLVNAIYMEGGPQTSLFLKIGDTKIEKIGSYISETYPNDKNNHFWNLPNVIGLKHKE